MKTQLFSNTLGAALLAALTLSQIPSSQADSSFTLAPQKGQEEGAVYEAFLSPHQEPDEEENVPAMTPKEFLSTAPSVPRSKRKSRGHGILRFTKDFSKAYVEVKVENVNPQDVVMFHIHCGKPDMLGPILVDFAHSGNMHDNLKDGVFSVEVTNADIVKAAQAGHSPISAFTSGCPIVPEDPRLGKVKTVAGMAHIAKERELYFNLHTKGQTFFGEMRGQLQPVK